MEEAGNLITEEDYLYLMERTFYLVKEAKESRHRPLASPLILRNKMYEFFSRKSSPLETHMLFEEVDLEQHQTIMRRKSLPSNEFLYKHIPQNSRRGPFRTAVSCQKEES